MWPKDISQVLSLPEAETSTKFWAHTLFVVSLEQNMFAVICFLTLHIWRPSSKRVFRWWDFAATDWLKAISSTFAAQQGRRECVQTSKCTYPYSIPATMQVRKIDTTPSCMTTSWPTPGTHAISNAQRLIKRGRPLSSWFGMHNAKTEQNFETKLPKPLGGIEPPPHYWSPRWATKACRCLDMEVGK
jgi:hypothetical protein